VVASPPRTSHPAFMSKRPRKSAALCRGRKPNCSTGGSCQIELLLITSSARQHRGVASSRESPHQELVALSCQAIPSLSQFPQFVAHTQTRRIPGKLPTLHCIVSIVADCQSLACEPQIVRHSEPPSAMPCKAAMPPSSYLAAPITSASRNILVRGVDNPLLNAGCTSDNRTHSPQ
jgi:hypothetical protein